MSPEIKVLIFMSVTGGGHLSVARAIAAALDELSEGRARCRIVDAFTDCAGFPINYFPQCWDFFTRVPPLWGAIWLATDNRSAQLIADVGRLLAEQRVSRLLNEEKPDVIVSTHPLSAPILVRPLARLIHRPAFINVITDLAIAHRAYLCPEADLTVVPTKEMQAALVRRGLPLSKVRALGLPIHPRFTRPGPDKAEARQRWQLSPQNFTLLLMGGAQGTGRLSAQLRALAPHLGWQIVVVTGHNQNLHRRLVSQSWPESIRIEGFIEDISTLMYASDLLITKGGACTLCEALACGLPMVIVRPMPGQEAGNAQYLVRHGAAWRIDSISHLKPLVEELAQPENQALARMKAAAQRLAHPRAAYDVAYAVLEFA